MQHKSWIHVRGRTDSHTQSSPSAITSASVPISGSFSFQSLLIRFQFQHAESLNHKNLPSASHQKSQLDHQVDIHIHSYTNETHTCKQFCKSPRRKGALSGPHLHAIHHYNLQNADKNTRDEPLELQFLDDFYARNPSKSSSENHAQGKEQVFPSENNGIPPRRISSSSENFFFFVCNRASDVSAIAIPKVWSLIRLLS